MSNKIAALLFVVATAMGGLLAYLVVSDTFIDPAEPGAPSKSFVVEKGWSSKAIAKNLEEKGFIKNWWSFYLLYRIQEKTSKDDNKKSILSGEYELSPGMSPRELLKKLKDHAVLYHKVVVPEGFNLQEVAQVMAGSRLTTLAEAERAMHETRLIAEFGIPARSMEGYLFPETYQFTRPEGAEAMVRKMFSEWKKNITGDMKSRASELGMSLHQILTLASIIEKETGVARERPIISSVFHNRLNISMPLQSDPTVIYGIKNFNGNLTKKDLKTPGPYNSYLNNGLPPGPICNPGLEAIKAALYPADTDYLYFVAKNDGSHYFSATYREHQRAVNKYQKHPKNSAYQTTSKNTESIKTGSNSQKTPNVQKMLGKSQKNKTKKPVTQTKPDKSKKEASVISHIDFK